MPHRNPHPFAWLMAAALVLAIVAAVLAPGRAPAVALYWNPIYRAEVALVVLALAYLLGVAGWMAWNGEAFRRIELPGGAALERDTQELDAAATGFGEFQASTIDRLDVVEATLERLNARVDEIERG
jgi:hypothetical protein